MNEARVVAKIRKAIIREYPEAWIFKVHGNPYQKAGVPDLLVCVEGRLVGIEVKHRKPGESRSHAIARTTPEQREQIRQINAAGGTAATALDEQEALAIIARALGPR